MIRIRAGFLLVAPVLLAGCASPDIKQQDLSALGPAPTAEDVSKIAHGPPLYRLDYLVDGETDTYELYAVADAGKDYALLFQAGRLSAVDVLDRSDYTAGPRTCTFFPPQPNFDVEDCLRKMNQSMKGAAVDLRQPVTPDQQAMKRSQDDTMGTVAEGAVEATMFAPILLPLAAIALPFAAAEKASDNSAQGSLGVKLGDSYQDIQARVEQIPEKQRSVVQGSGTVLVPAGWTGLPAAAFGLQGGKVVWLQLGPSASCQMGGDNCRMGFHARPIQHFRAQTPPVIDEQENLALYYSPPPHYEVIGRVGGTGSGFSAESSTEHAIKDMKSDARKEGATGVLLDSKPKAPDQEEPTPAPPPGTGSPVYAVDGTRRLLFNHNWTEGWAIYVQADADAFLKASKAHAATCDALSQKKDDAKDAYKAIKGSGAPADIAAAQAKLQSAEDTSDAAYCGDDDWYAEQMTGQKD